MLSLRTDTYTINKNGNAQYELFADVSTRKLESITVGESSGKISKGTGNAFVGFESGKNNLEGSFGVFVGFQAGSFNQNGNWNTYVGAYAGQKNNRGANNTFIGFNAGQCNADGSECTAIGVNAMRENSVGNRNVAVGIRAGERILEGDDNTMIGSEAGQNIRSGNLNTMAGFRAGRGAFRGNENTYFGAYSGYSNAEGNANSLIGYKAGEFLTVGDYNVAVGAYTLQNLTNGSSNISIGAFAGANVSGTGNVLLGTMTASCNSLGNDNTIIGKNAGRNTIGDRNVVIGSDAGLFMVGGCNVVIGSDSFSHTSNMSSGCVVIGHNAGTNTYRNGSNNIFIGIGADTNIENTSHAISIGAELTLSSDHSISIGENIQNGGFNAVIIGYGLYSDSDNCISLGHNININNVDVFSDPLNSIFPVTNETDFELEVAYTDMLGGACNVSNTVAIASLYTSNIYDSGLNLQTEPTISADINLLDLFEYTVLYHPFTIQHTDSVTFSSSFSNYIVTCNLIDTNTNISIPSIDSNLNVNISTNTNSIIITTDSTLPNIAYNLIPESLSNFTYNIYVARRLIIDVFPNSHEYSVYQTEPLNILLSNLTIGQESGSTSNNDSIAKNSNINPINKYYIYNLPTYGFFDSRISSNSTLTYTRHIESLYAITDTFSMVVANNVANAYTILPEELLIKTDVITFTDSNNVHIQSNIYFNPLEATVFDRSYLNIINPSPAMQMTIVSIDSNILYSPLPSEYTYNNFIINPILFTVTNNPLITSFEPLEILVDGSTYVFNCFYKNIVHYPNTTCNITMFAEPFSMATLSEEYTFLSNIYITKQPEYGTLNITSSNFSYIPHIYNFGEDTFSIVTGNTSNFDTIQNTELVVSVQISNTYKSLILNKIQEPSTSNQEVTFITQDNPIITTYPLLTTVSSVSNITQDTTTTTITGDSSNIEYTGTYNNTLFGIVFFGYPAVSNIVYNITLSNLSNVVGAELDYIEYNSCNITTIIYNAGTGNSNYSSTVSYTSNLPPNYTLSNNAGISRYYRLDYSESNITTYNIASNMAIYNLTEDQLILSYYDLYNTHIYDSQVSESLNETSNIYIPITTNSSNVVTSIAEYSNVIRKTHINYNIPTIELNDYLVYNYNGSYTLSSTHPQNLILLQKNIGAVTSFHQSNISNKEVHIYNTGSDGVSNVVFENDKFIQINYLINGVTPENPILDLSTLKVSFSNGVTSGVTLNTSNLQFAISYSCNIAFLDSNLVPKMHYGSNTFSITPLLIDPSSYETAYIEYIAYNDTIVYKGSHFIEIEVFFMNKPLYINSGLNIPKKYITSNDMQYITTVASNVQYQFPSSTSNIVNIYNNDILLTGVGVITFTQQDINDNKIRIENIGVLAFTNITTNIINTNNNTPLSSTNIVSFNKYFQNNYPNTDVTASLINLHLNEGYYSKEILGLNNLWNNIESFQESNTFLYIVEPPINGFLYSSNSYTITNRMSYADFKSKSHTFIPYVPMNIVNDTLTFFIEYSGVISPIYTLIIKNYWSKWSEIVISPDNIVSTVSLYRSQGMIDDNIAWSNINESIITLNYKAIQTTLSVTTEPLLQRPILEQTEPIEITCTIANYAYLQGLLQTQDVVFYIINPPTNGVILKDTEGAVGYFTSSEIINNRVYYQHFGRNTSIGDSFTVKIATNPFDLSIDSLTVNIIVVPNIIINTNIRDYVYYENNLVGYTTYNPLTTSRLSLSGGSLYIYELNNIEIFKKNLLNDTYTPTTIITQEELINGLIYYKPSESFFVSGSNKNEVLSFKFVTNNLTEPNKLSVFPIYQNIYTREWFARYNTYESSNVIIETLDNEQVISYTTTDLSTSRFADKKCTFQFEHRTYNVPLIHSSNPVAVEYSSNVVQYKYSFEITDMNDVVFFKIEYTENTIDAFFEGSNLNINTTISPPTLLWNTFAIVNNDNTNNNNTSIYLNGVNYTDYREETAPTFSINERLKSFKQMRIRVLLDDTTFSNPNVISIDENTKVYYNLQNYHSSIYFRNFKILEEAIDVNNLSYNVVIGDQLKINGYNNVCIGKNFATTGTGSIIVGNDIGAEPNTLIDTNTVNEIFNSIIISTSSFRNTKVRDIIAIGNNILNNASTLGNIDEVDSFLAKRPVLVGNDITLSNLDFHINFQNTFLKTSVGHPQIYCGLENEAVCIGYSNNVGLCNEQYKLYVNGGINTIGAVCQSSRSGSVRFKKEVFGYVSLDTLHILSITWDANITIDVSVELTVSVKLKIIKDGLYYYFENWVIPFNDTVYVINETSGITNFNHTTSIVDNSILIEFNTYTGIAVIEVETIAPSSLGDLSISICLKQ